MSNAVDMQALREKALKAPGYIDPEHGQWCGPFTRCKCGNDKLELRGKFWCCTDCGTSYGEYASQALRSTP